MEKGEGGGRQAREGLGAGGHARGAGSAPGRGGHEDGMYRIAFLNGKLKGRRLTVQQGTVRIGRAPDCSVRLSDPAMADHHALVEEREGRLFLRNLDPVQGVNVDGRKLLTGELELGAAGELVLGGTRLRIEVVTAAPARRRHRIGATQAIASLSVAGVIAAEIWLMVHYAMLNPLLQAAAGPAAPSASGGAQPALPGASDEAASAAEPLPPEAIPPAPEEMDSKNPDAG